MVQDTGSLIKISIHALREEGDLLCMQGKDILLDFYPRPPRGGRLPTAAMFRNLLAFLSTPSARRATNAVQLILEGRSISIHALREEGDLWCWGHAACLFISIHALREEGDQDSGCRVQGGWNFYPRPPRGGRPCSEQTTKAMFGISIHALREEGDVPPLVRSRACSNFYPRPPRGGRRPPILGMMNL